jgi:hypothetical protein
MLQTPQQGLSRRWSFLVCRPLWRRSRQQAGTTRLALLRRTSLWWASCARGPRRSSSPLWTCCACCCCTRRPRATTPPPPRTSSGPCSTGRAAAAPPSPRTSSPPHGPRSTRSAMRPCRSGPGRTRHRYATHHEQPTPLHFVWEGSTETRLNLQ